MQHLNRPRLHVPGGVCPACYLTHSIFNADNKITAGNDCGFLAGSLARCTEPGFCKSATRSSQPCAHSGPLQMDSRESSSPERGVLWAQLVTLVSPLSSALLLGMPVPCVGAFPRFPWCLPHSGVISHPFTPHPEDQVLVAGTWLQSRFCKAETER